MVNEQVSKQVEEIRKKKNPTMKEKIIKIFDKFKNFFK